MPGFSDEPTIAIPTADTCGLISLRLGRISAITLRQAVTGARWNTDRIDDQHNHLLHIPPLRTR